MPSTIPYNPSLALGNIVHHEKLAVLQSISDAQAPVDAAEDELNGLLALRRSFDMTIQELMDMDVETGDMAAQRAEVNNNIKEAAKKFAQTKIAAEKAIVPLRAKIKTVGVDLESPIDYNRTEIKTMPLSADSLKMNCQFFGYDQNKQDSKTQAGTISAFVSEETEFLGFSISSSASGAASSQVNSQYQKHEIAGTLVVSVTCTHKNAVVLAPFIIDADKAIRVWNRLYPDAMIKMDDPADVVKIAKEANTKDEKSMTLLSGATYGSCFIGMVHVLNTTTTQASEAMYSLAGKVQSQFKAGGWFANETGGFGVESTFSNDTKNLLSMQNISAHCTLVAMGSIPSIKSNEVAMGVKGFADDDGAKSMAALAKLQNATAGANNSLDAAASAARTGGQFVTLQNAKIEATLSALATIDNQNNKLLDTNSMMDALDDYIQKALAGNLGVPINYYTKPITRSELAQLWVAKYYPGKFVVPAGDDDKPTPPAPPPTNG